MARVAWWAKHAQRTHPQSVAKPVIVTRDLQMIDKETIVAACQARGIGLEIPGKFDKDGAPVKVPLVKLAEKVGIEGEYFRSRREAGRYIQLRHLEQSGVVRGLKRNPNFKLHTVNPAGLKVVITEYTGDFEFEEEVTKNMLAATMFDQPVGWQHVIEESKGFPTKDWELRRKWVEAEYGIKIRVT